MNAVTETRPPCASLLCMTVSGSHQCFLMSLVVSSSGDFPHKSGPIQCSCPHFLVAAAMVRWSSLWAACFLIAKRALGPQIALLRDCSPFTVHRKRIRSVLSFHSFVSCRLPYSALSSALSFRGSPRCGFTLTRKVAAPASTLRLSASMISFSMSAFTLSASVARWPSHINAQFQYCLLEL